MNRQNPQPTPKPSVDTIRPGGHIALTKQTTYVTEPGEVGILSAKTPGARKHVVATEGEVRVTGDNLAKPVTLSKPGDFCLLEWTGYDWTTIYGARKTR